MTTLLILVGGASYPHAPALRHPSFERSSKAVATLLTIGGSALLPTANHLDLFNDGRAWSEQLMVIRGWLRAMIPAATKEGIPGKIENVVVHYVGHGMFKANSEEHYLSINATDTEDRSMTSASLGELNAILLKNALEQRRFYVIDACFAAASIRNLMGIPEDAIEVNVGGILGAWPERPWGDSGVAALCSAGRTATASAAGERNLTQFTDGLLAVLESGDEASGCSLSLRRTHQLLRATLMARYGDNAVHPVLVAPEDRDGGIAGAPFFPNMARRARHPDGPDAPRAEHPAARVAGSGHADPAAVSHRPPEGAMVPEARNWGPTDWGLALGDAAASETEKLSPEQRFRQAAYRFFRLPHSEKG